MPPALLVCFNTRLQEDLQTNERQVDVEYTMDDDQANKLRKCAVQLREGKGFESGGLIPWPVLITSYELSRRDGRLAATCIGEVIVLVPEVETRLIALGG